MSLFLLFLFLNLIFQVFQHVFILVFSGFFILRLFFLLIFFYKVALVDNVVSFILVLVFILISI